ncbi:E3 ubiquitin-protein ligase RNF170-like [Heptranchias perlo]|uniref:E3 ubiquitin-protein ligase RNF170-like n=1 Tax=Heptranchias perlo TaxID=212740 RepID=UPI00355A3705
MFPQHYFCPSSKATRLDQTKDNRKAKGLNNQCMGQTRDNYYKNYSELKTRSKSHFHSDLHCPVCLQMPTFPVETNCTHMFCGPCLIAYWRHGSWLGAVSCPLCRQKVSLLYSLFCENQQEKQGRQIVRDIRDYNKRFSGQPRTFADYVFDMPLLLQLAFRGLFTIAGLVWIFCLRVAICSFGAIICLTSPLDEFPETFNGILGTADDLTVVILLLFCMINICQQMGPEGTSLTSTRTQNL